MQPPAMSNCTVCGSVPRGLYYFSMRGTMFCASHRNVQHCTLCGAGGRSGSSGWAQLSPTMLRCPACAVGAVDDKAALRLHVPAVRAGLRSLGLELEGRVRISVVSSDQMVSSCRISTPNLLGVTAIVEDLASGQRQAVEVQVLRGLPPLWFGATAAHENMHAWLAEHGIRTPRPEIEEGLCEVVAYGWLGLQQDPLAQSVRESMKQSSDPVYGAGLREVQGLVRRHGLRRVLEVLRATGDVPR